MKHASGLLAATWLTCIVLGLLAGAATWYVTGSDDVFETSQVLGVQTRGTGTPDGSVTSASQWSIVGSSAPFRAQIAADLSRGQVSDGDLQVTSEQGSPVLIVSARGDSEADAEALAAKATAGLIAQSMRTDQRYPLTGLTVASTRAQTGVPQVAVSVIAAVLAAALAAVVATRGRVGWLGDAGNRFPRGRRSRSKEREPRGRD